jgi:hypothetical protein
MPKFATKYEEQAMPALRPPEGLGSQARQAQVQAL